MSDAHMHCKPGFVYLLRDPRTMDVRYVGFTTAAVVKRAKHHMAAARSNRNTGKTGGNVAKERWLLELDALGLAPIPEEVRRVANAWEGEYWEQKVIAKSERGGAQLFNHVRSSQLADGYAELTREGRKSRLSANQVAKRRCFGAVRGTTKEGGG